MPITQYRLPLASCIQGCKRHRYKQRCSNCYTQSSVGPPAPCLICNSTHLQPAAKGCTQADQSSRYHNTLIIGCLTTCMAGTTDDSNALPAGFLAAHAHNTPCMTPLQQPSSSSLEPLNGLGTTCIQCNLPTELHSMVSCMPFGQNSTSRAPSPARPNWAVTNGYILFTICPQTLQLMHDSCYQ
jgi:hypothetical protein